VSVKEGGGRPPASGGTVREDMLLKCRADRGSIASPQPVDAFAKQSAHVPPKWFGASRRPSGRAVERGGPGRAATESVDTAPQTRNARTVASAARGMNPSGRSIDSGCDGSGPLCPKVG